jgi:hypothetical protein
MHGKNNYLSNKSSTKILAHVAKVNKYMSIFEMNDHNIDVDSSITKNEMHYVS